MYNFYIHKKELSLSKISLLYELKHNKNGDNQH